MKFKQKYLASKVGLSESHISQILGGTRRPSWKKAKKLAEATGTTPELWLDGKPAEIRRAIEAA